jgi:AcrR family transcriptional regulator
MIDTKQKILDTAERLFGEQGYAATSLRQVIAEAEVNVAAVHYHFGCKEDLLHAVLSRNADPLTVARMERLDRVEREAGAGPPDLEKVLEAFLIPTAEMAQHSPRFVRLMGRMLNDGMMPAIVERHFRDSAMRFVHALSRAVPHLGQDELMWRIHFMIGAMAHTMGNAPLYAMAPSDADYDTRMRRLIKFLGSGFRAPAEQTRMEEQTVRSR